MRGGSLPRHDKAVEGAEGRELVLNPALEPRVLADLFSQLHRDRPPAAHHPSRHRALGAPRQREERVGKLDLEQLRHGVGARDENLKKIYQNLKKATIKGLLKSKKG